MARWRGRWVTSETTMTLRLTVTGGLALIGGLIWIAKKIGGVGSSRRDTSGDGGALIADGTSSGHHHDRDCGPGDPGGDGGGGDSGGSDGGGGGDGGGGRGGD